MGWERWSPTGGTKPWRIRELIRVVMGLHSTFSTEIWLWRGQSQGSYRLEPGMHTRVRTTPDASFDETTVRAATNKLIEMARANRLDRVEDLRLPDLALLAHLRPPQAAHLGASGTCALRLR